MKKLDYNMQAAIAMRGEIWEDDMGHKEVIGFRSSLQITSNEGSNPFDWQYPLHIEVLCGNTYTWDEMRKITKKEWKHSYGAYRKYMKQCYDSHNVNNH